MTNGFTFIDSLILVIYLVSVLSLGFYFSRKRDKNTSDYFLGGRNAGWFAVGMTIFATNISSEHFMGLAGSGATRGLAVGQFELMAIFILILLGWFIAPLYIKTGITTVPEFLEKRYDARSRKFFSGLSIIIYLFTKISVTLFAGGILFYKMFGINVYASAIIIVLITGLYSVIGGGQAIIKTQVFQAIMLILGGIFLTFFGLKEVGGFSGLESKLPADFFTMFKPMDDPDYPWTGIIFGAPIIAFWYWCTDQYIVQRLLSANTINDARRGTLLTAFLKLLPVFILVLPGLIAVALYPEITGDEAYPVLLSSNFLPVGIKGFVVAGLLAAIMSSLSGVFSSTATLFTHDFYKARHPEANERKLVLIGRLATTAIVVAAILCVPLVKIVNSQMYLFLQSVQSYVSPPITAVFIFGFISKKITAKAAIWTLIIGEVIGFSRLLMDILVDAGIVTSPLMKLYTDISFLHFAIFLFVISSVLIVAISYITIKQKEQSFSQYTFAESLNELRFNISNRGTVSTYKINLMLSAFIVLIIISLWSLWY